MGVRLQTEVHHRNVLIVRIRVTPENRQNEILKPQMDSIVGSMFCLLSTTVVFRIHTALHRLFPAAAGSSSL